MSFIYFHLQWRVTTFTLQQEVPPEGDDGLLLVGHLLLLREVDSEEAADRLSRQLSRRFAEDAAKGCREELHLDWTRGFVLLVVWRWWVWSDGEMKYLLKDAQSLQTLPKPEGGAQQGHWRAASSGIQMLTESLLEHWYFNIRFISVLIGEHQSVPKLERVWSLAVFWSDIGWFWKLRVILDIDLKKSS